MKIEISAASYFIIIITTLKSRNELEKSKYGCDDLRSKLLFKLWWYEKRFRVSTPLATAPLVKTKLVKSEMQIRHCTGENAATDEMASQFLFV